MTVAVVIGAMAVFLTGLQTWDAWRRVSRNEALFPGGPWRKFAASVVSTGLTALCLAAAQLYCVLVLGSINHHLLQLFGIMIGLSVTIMVAVRFFPPLRQLQRDYSAVTLPPRLRTKASVSAGRGAL